MKIKRRIVWLSIISLLMGSLAGCNRSYVPYDYDISKYITLGEYKGVTCDFINVGVTDADLQQAVWTDMKEHGYGTSTEIVSGQVLPGDVVKIDFVGSIDGQVDPALGASGLELEVGSETFLDGFEEGLLGQEIGKTCEVDVVYPDDYIKTSYAGKTVSYEVTIHSATRMTYPELTDDIVIDISSYKNVDEYYSEKRAQLEKESLQLADEERETQLWDQVVANATVIEYPKDAIEFLSEQARKQFADAADEEDQTLQEYLKTNNLSDGEYEDYVLARAKRLCKDEMVMYAIARQESIEVSDDETKQLAQTYVENYGYKSIKDLYSSYSKELVKQTLLYQKVKDFVVANATEK